jgi:hypothetical protein
MWKFKCAFYASPHKKSSIHLARNKPFKLSEFIVHSETINYSCTYLSKLHSVHLYYHFSHVFDERRINDQ